ncbi:MAG: hypothetical protein JWR52_1363 [Marmoricola sp.]|nr:hypothetical protein [Marmoricola sp.]
MTDKLEDLVADELRRRAADADVPPLAVAHLIARGHEARRVRARRTLTVVAAVVAAALVTVVVAVGHSDDPGSTRPPGPAATPTGAPRTLSELPSGPPPRVVYSSGRTVHLSGRTVELPFVPDHLVPAGDAVLASSARGSVVWIDRATGATATLTTTAGSTPVATLTGGWVAWLKATKGSAIVVLVGVGSHGAIDERFEQRFPAKPSCCSDPFELNGIVGADQLIASMPSQQKAWSWSLETGGSSARPASSIQLLGGLGQQGITVIDHTLVLTDAAGGTTIAGLFNARIEAMADTNPFPIVPGGAGGQAVAYLDDGGKVRVGPFPGAAVGNHVFGFPQTGDPVTLFWDDATHVLLVYTIGSTRATIVRCAISTGSCERAAELGPAYAVEQ